MTHLKKNVAVFLLNNWGEVHSVFALFIAIPLAFPPMISHLLSALGGVILQSMCKGSLGIPITMPMTSNFSSLLSDKEPDTYANHFFWASLVSQAVKNLPAMWKTQVQSLGGENPLVKGMTAQSSILAWRITWTEEPGEFHGIAESDTTGRLTRSHSHFHDRGYLMTNIKHLSAGALPMYMHWNIIIISPQKAPFEGNFP